MTIEKYASADKPDRLKVLSQGFVKRLKDFGLAGLKITEPDFAKLEASMKKTNKPVVFTIRFENDKFIAETSNAGTVLTVAAIDLAKEGDRTKRRALLQAINDHSSLASSADLAAFDQKFPDPQKVAEAKAEVARLEQEIKRDEEWKGKRPKSVKTMLDSEREVSFQNWAKGKTYEKFLNFVVRVENGGAPKDIAEEFIKTGAPKAIKLRDATQKAVEDALQKNQALRLAQALTEAIAVVDARMLPTYNGEILKAITDRLTENKKKLATAKAKYKAVGGK